MSAKRLLPASLLLVAGLAAPAFAQYAPAPTSYTVTQVFYPPSGSPITMTISRDGPVVLERHEGNVSAWNYYDLGAHTNYGWNTGATECSANAFTGDWGDPFATAEIAGELAAVHARETGAEVINGIRTKVLDGEDPQGGGKVRVWLDATYGEPVKAITIDASKKVTPMLELKNLTLGKPAVAAVLPAMCARTPITPLPAPQLNEAQRIAMLTGSAPGTYASAVNGPGSTEACAVDVSVAMTKTMAVVGGGYRVAIDPSVDPDHPATYSQPGDPFFRGGGLREITALLRNGVARLPVTGAAFNMQISTAPVTFANTIYRQCFGRSTAKLFYVVTSTAAFNNGEWVWAK